MLPNCRRATGGRRNKKDTQRHSQEKNAAGRKKRVRVEQHIKAHVGICPSVMLPGKTACQLHPNRRSTPTKPPHAARSSSLRPRTRPPPTTSASLTTPTYILQPKVPFVIWQVRGEVLVKPRCRRRADAHLGSCSSRATDQVAGPAAAAGPLRLHRAVPGARRRERRRCFRHTRRRGRAKPGEGGRRG